MIDAEFGLWCVGVSVGGHVYDYFVPSYDGDWAIGQVRAQLRELGHGKIRFLRAQCLCTLNGISSHHELMNLVKKSIHEELV